MILQEVLTKMPALHGKLADCDGVLSLAEEVDNHSYFSPVFSVGCYMWCRTLEC